MTNRFRIHLIATLMMLSNRCDERVAHVAIDAAERQADQNKMMAELQREVADGTSSLVQADADARKDMLAAHQQLQSERRELDSRREAMQVDRLNIMGQRQTLTFLVPLISVAGGLILVFDLLCFSWYTLSCARIDENVATELNELLLLELTAENPVLELGVRQFGSAETKEHLQDSRSTLSSD